MHFLLVLIVVRRWTASTSSYVFVLMPPVALGDDDDTAEHGRHGDRLAPDDRPEATGVYTGALWRRGEPAHP